MDIDEVLYKIFVTGEQRKIAETIKVAPNPRQHNQLTSFRGPIVSMPIVALLTLLGYNALCCPFQIQLCCVLQCCAENSEHTLNMPKTVTIALAGALHSKFLLDAQSLDILW